MSNFFDFLSTDTLVAKTIVILIVVGFTVITLLFIVAFFQGRKITLWPPSIDPKSDGIILVPDVSEVITNDSVSNLEEWKRKAIVDHDQLFGVDSLIKSLDEKLINPDANWIISIFGEGGIGKTALAFELVKRCQNQKKFTRIAWASAKQKYMTPGGDLGQQRGRVVFWNDLLEEIAEQIKLDLGPLAMQRQKEFARRIHQLPTNEKCLIIIDNLEDLSDAQEVVRYIEQERLINPHKYIITTRKSISGQSIQVIEQSLKDLDEHDARLYIRHLGKDDPNISRATNPDLDAILSVTEGNPFLIKLAVRRFVITRQPIERVVGELKSKKKDLGEKIEQYLYSQSFTELEHTVGNENAMNLMNAFCAKPQGESFSYDELYQFSNISDGDLFERARQMGISLALIRALDQNKRFAVHSLLHQFLCSV